MVPPYGGWCRVVALPIPPRIANHFMISISGRGHFVCSARCVKAGVYSCMESPTFLPASPASWYPFGHNILLYFIMEGVFEYVDLMG
jgi:hypothetical protein